MSGYLREKRSKTEKLRLLVVEHNDEDYRHLVGELRRSRIGNTSMRVRTKIEFEKVFKEHKPDIVICDYSLARFPGMEALRVAQHLDPLIPVIMTSGSMDEESVIGCIKAGAVDYVVKGEKHRIASAVRNALKARGEKQKFEKNLQDLRKLSSAVESTADNVVITDAKGIIEYVNPAFERRTGYKKQEAIGKTPALLKSGHHPEEFYKEMWRTILSGKVFRAEFMNKRKDGTLYYQEETITPVFDRKGHVTHFVSTGRDVTERKHSEELLKTSEERFSKVFSSSPIGTAITSLDEGRFIDVNPAFVRIYGYSREEVINHTSLELNLWVDAGERTRMARLVRENGETHEFELHIRTRSGELRNAIFSAEVIEVSGAKCILGLTQDVTERKRSEEALRRNEYLMRESQRVGRIGSYETDFISGYWQSSSVLDEIFGITENYARTVDGWAGLIHPDDRKDMEDYLAKIIGDRARFQKDYRIVRPSDGKVRWVSGKGELTFARDGRLLRMIGTIQDITERRETEEALQKERDLLRGLMDNVPDGIYFKDAQSRFVEINIAQARLFGLHDPALAVGKTDFNFFAEEHARQAYDDEQKIVRDGRPVIGKEEKEIWLDGHTRWISTTKMPLKDRKGWIVGTMGISRDITERKAAEQAVRISESRFRSVWDNSADGMRLTDHEGHIVAVNAAYCTLVKMPQDDLLGRVFSVTYFEHGSDDSLDIYKQQFDSRQIHASVSATVKLWNGEVVEMDISNSFIEYGAQDRLILSIFRDVTARRMAETALRESEARFRSIFETSPIGIASVDINGKFIRVNPTLEQMLGYREAEMKEKSFNEITHPDDILIGAQELRELVDGRKDRAELEKRYMHKAGHTLWVHLVISSVRDPGGRLLYTVSMIEDITERRRTEERQRILEAQLVQAQKMEAVGTLAGGIAHDFNNILGIILGHLSLLQRPGLENAIRASSLETAVKAVKRGAGLVKQILTFARKSDVSRELVNVNTEAVELVKMLKETFPKTIEIRIEPGEPNPIVNVDLTQFHQALMNLCINARDAMLDPLAPGLSNGELKIRTSKTSGTRLREKFPEADASEYIAVSVADTGCGMDESVKQKIFEPFFTTKEIGKGTGLGLAVVYGVVSSHEGFVEVETAIDKGTTFTIYFPSAKSYSATMENPPPAATEDLRGNETILAVEDEAEILESLKTMLEAAGYKVLTAVNGIEAIEQFEQARKEIALVISDVGLPKLGGGELVKELKLMEPGVKILLASGYLEPEYKTVLLSAGAKEIIQKPYELGVVLRKIRDALDAKTGPPIAPAPDSPG